MDHILQANISSLSEQKYINLRKRLDQLGYRQTLGIESLPLIEKLFNDLVHTTESLKKAKLEISKNVDQMNTSLKNASNISLSGDLTTTTSIQAYKADNAKLIKENNELHLQLIKIKDDFEIQIKEMKTKLNKIEHENSDLRFLNTQYLHKLRSIEKESKDKSKKILELQEKNFQAIIQTSGNKQQIPFRRQRLDIDCMLPLSRSLTNRSIASSVAASSNDPYIIDMIKLADQRITQLQSDLDSLRQTNEIVETKMNNYKSQVENREKEIERLNNLLDGGRSYDVVSLEANLKNNEKIVAHQNIQIEFLQEKNHNLEKQLHELLQETKHEFINEDLKNDYKQLNRLAKKTELENQLILNKTDRKLDQAKYDLERSKEELNSLDNIIQRLEIENRNLTNELFNVKTELNEKNIEIHNLFDLINKIQDDKTKLSKKVSKLLENERELVQEIDSIKPNISNRHSHSNLTRSNSHKSLTTKLDSHIKNIENERDFYKQEVNTLQKLVKTFQSDFKPDSNSKSNSKSNSNKSTSNLNHKSRKSLSPKRAKSISPDSFNRCSVCIQKLNKPSSQSPSKKLCNQSEEIYQLKKERDELKSLLDKFERHMSEIQSNIKILTSEKDKYNRMYEEAKNELHLTRRELLNKGASAQANVSLATQAILKRVETERDTALIDLRNTINERDSLRERLKLTNEATNKDKSNFEKQIDELHDRLKKTDIEKNELDKQIDLLQKQLEQLEKRIETKNYHLVQTEQELNDQKSASTQIRYLAEESERALEEQRRQLSIKTEELHQMEQIKFRLEQKIIDIQDLNRNLKEEINSLRLTIASLDKDKDKLLMNIDEKTVENVTFKQELANKHRRIDELNVQLTQLDAALDRSNDELKAKIKEITTIRIQIDRINEENCDLNRRYESACRENKRLQDDLITITRENQVLHCELEKSNGDKDSLKEQLKDYVNEVSKFEELLKQKEQDRSNLFEQYRDITNELNQMKITLNSFENETSNLKIEIQMKHADNKRLRERLEIIERDFQQQLSVCQEYEVKLSNANRNLQRLEEQNKKIQLDNKELIQDLMNSRELNSHLEQTKEDLTRQISTRELELEQLQNQLGDKRAENDLLKSQVNSERTMVKNLEELIANNREKDFQMQLSTQERDSEIKLLKDRIVLSEQKIQTQNKEINSLRSKIVENETDFERLKRQLTNERFERERAAQELRKLSDNADLNASNSRLMRSISPIRVPIPVSTAPGILCNPVSIHSIPPPSSIFSQPSNQTSTAVAAAVAATNVAAVANGYRSLSPIRSTSPSKDNHLSNHSLSSSSIRYSSSNERKICHQIN